MSRRSVLVTGAAGGIGAAVAKAFVEDGAQVFGLDIKAPLGDIEPLTADLRDEVAVAAAFAQIEARCGKLDAIANVAGLNHRATLEQMQVADWDRMMDINVGGMFLTAKYGLPLLAKSPAPAIVNMSSISGQVASADFPAYVTTKAAVDSFTAALAQEAGSQGVRVNAVAPGWVDAGFTHAAMAEASDPAELGNMAARVHLLGRMAKPEEIANAFVWLASPEASFVTGQTLYVDGGLMRLHG